MLSSEWAYKYYVQVFYLQTLALVLRGARGFFARESGLYFECSHVSWKELKGRTPKGYSFELKPPSIIFT